MRKIVNQNKKRKILPVLVLTGALLMINSVFALYYFGSFNFSLSVNEPFTSYYSVLNPSDELYSTAETLGCQSIDYYLNWNEINSDIIDIGNKYVGDEGIICFRIDSDSSEDIDINYELIGDWDENVNVTRFVLHDGIIDEGQHITSVVPENGQLWGLLTYEIGTGANGDYNLVVEFSR